jgi:hypothetical protein
MNEFRVEWSERQSLMLSGTWRDTEYRLDVCRVTNDAHTEIY